MDMAPNLSLGSGLSSGVLHICKISNLHIYEFFNWLVVLGFNATLIAKVPSWRSVTHMCLLSLSHQY